jgi:putative sigma-54 modulation protein
LCKLEQQIVRHNQKKTNEKRHPKTAAKDAVLETVPGVPVKAVLKRTTAVAAAAKNGTVRKAVAMVVHSFPSRSPLVEPHIVRSIDSAAMRPMSLEEAVKEAAFRDRDVFVFRDHEGQALVLHRKRDGKMELIQVP